MPGRLVWEAPAGEECTVAAGDLVGWYSAGAGVLAYDDGRTGCAVGDEVRAP